MLENIPSLLRTQCQLDPLRPTIVAVSGGPDSLCLMDVLREAQHNIIVAHFNHTLREGSNAEAEAVESLAARFGLPFVMSSGDVRAFAYEKKLSIEEAARIMRYQFLFETTRAQSAQAIAVGHTADDQAETVLMHFLRGAGLNGLKGMSHRTLLMNFDAEIPVVRPLLDTWREETVLYCAEHGLHPHFDPSNDSTNFLRNRLRHLLIPTLETYNPKFREAAWRTAQLLHADHALVNELVDAAWMNCVVTESSDLIAFDGALLAGLSSGLLRHLLRRALEHVALAADVNYVTLNRAEALIRNPARPSHTHLTGGARLLCEADQIFVAAQNAVLPIERWPQLPAEADEFALLIPAKVELSGGWIFTAEKWNIPALAWEQMQENEDPFQVWLDAQALKGNLSLRARADGDRFEPLGMDGHTQKLSDFFTNVKLPQRARDRWPILCAGEIIAWVPGHQPAHPFRLKQSSRQIVHFHLIAPVKK